MSRHPAGPDRHDGADVRARMPADVDAPDPIVYGLTFRQLAVLAVAAVLGYTAWRSLHTLLPVPMLAGGFVLLGGLAFGLAVGRRDGLALDVWLRAAVRHHRTPTALSATGTTATVPDWVQAPPSKPTLPAPLQLPADAIDVGGQISLSGVQAAMVAATTVNLALRTAAEQAALTSAFGQWLNSLSTPTQIVVSAQPVDLHAAARQLAGAAARISHPALADAAVDHARFLAELAERRDPLRRQVLVVVTGTGPGERGGHAARRRGEATARSLSGLGITARALDGTAATAALAAACDPYRPPRPGGLAAPDTVITAPPARRSHPRRTS